ncbi:hypothetical protein BJ170DRAFT_369977 [Xylariales sp. AK1849]|nr:hypothetical protein BJ170DRAFT_369977 [Xylariales sp. AK1849]
MINDPISDLGLSCPNGGAFYICQGSKVRFLGCCDVDPCADGSGTCPSSSLRAASFKSASYGDIPAETCEENGTNYGPDIGYTCANDDPPFLGCCLKNPCDEGCSQACLIAARLDDDPSKAAPFLTPSTSQTSSAISITSNIPTTITVTGTAYVTTTPVSAPEASTRPANTQNTPLGAIVGGTVGGPIVLIAVTVIMWWKRRKGYSHESSAQADQMEITRQPYSPFKGKSSICSSSGNTNSTQTR